MQGRRSVPSVNKKMTLWKYVRQKLSPILDLQLDSDFFVLLKYQFILHG